MKRLVLILTVLFSVTAFANRESGGRGGANAVFLVFTNPGYGYGIDATTLSYAEAYIDHAFTYGWIADGFRMPWGQSGELTLCLQFQGGEFDGANIRHVFLKSVSQYIVRDALAIGAQRTFAYVGTTCNVPTDATLQDVWKLAN